MKLNLNRFPHETVFQMNFKFSFKFKLCMKKKLTFEMRIDHKKRAWPDGSPQCQVPLLFEKRKIIQNNHSLPFVVTRCHYLSLVVQLVVSSCHSLYHSLPLVINRCIPRLCFCRRSFLTACQGTKFLLSSALFAIYEKDIF